MEDHRQPANFVTSLRGSIVSPKLEQFVLKLDNLYSNLIAQDSLSQTWTACFKISQLVSKLDSLSQNQTACVKSDNVSPAQTVCPKGDSLFHSGKQDGSSSHFVLDVVQVCCWQCSESKA